MKRTLLLFMLFTIASSMMAQSYLKFEGIPICGTLKECTSKLINMGFHLDAIDKSSKKASLTGDFSEYTNCLLFVRTTSKDVVNQIEVHTPTCNSWTCLFKTYTDMVNRFCALYGKPSIRKEIFHGDQQPNSDFEKLNEVNSGQCEYSTTFSVGNGTINVMICSQKNVVVDYLEKESK